MKLNISFQKCIWEMPTPIFGNLIKTSDSVMMYVIQYVLYNFPITRGHNILDTLQKCTTKLAHRVLGSCGFQWCNFHLCTFSKK